MSSLTQARRSPRPLSRLDDLSFSLSLSLSLSFSFLRVFPLALWSTSSTVDNGMLTGALANATGLEISSSIFSSMPQKRLNGSSVSGTAPKLTYDSAGSDEDDEDAKGERETEGGAEGR